MKLRDFLTTEVHKLMVVDANENLIFCGRDRDPGSFATLYPHLGRDVQNIQHSGTYLLLTVGEGVK